MSVKAMEWAAEAPLTGSDKWVLLSLAWFADDARGTAYPGQRALAAWAGLSLRTVRDALVRLEADGWIVRERRTTDQGWRTSDLYRLTPGREPERERRHERLAGQPARLAARPTGEARRTANIRPTGEARPSANRRGSPGEEELRSSLEPLVERDTPAAPEKPKRRGSRIPDDWALTEPLRAFARERVAWSTPEALAEEFVDYWRSAAGAKAVKVDWDLTFQTWVRNAVKYGPPRGWTPPAQVSNPVDDYERRVRAWLNRGGVDYGEWRAAQRDPDLMEAVLAQIGSPVPVR